MSNKKLALTISLIVTFAICIFSILRNINLLIDGVNSVACFYMIIDNIFIYILIISYGIYKAFKYRENKDYLKDVCKRNDEINKGN